MPINGKRNAKFWSLKPLLLLVAGFFACSLVYLYVGIDDAKAQSRAQICNQLNAQLASLVRGGASGGNPRKYRQYDNAIRKQGGQIQRAKRALRRNGCIGALNRTRSSCRAINTSLKKMQANLAGLKRERARYAPKQANNSNKRRKLIAAMQRNRCNAQTRQAAAEPQQKSRRRTLLEQVFGVRTYNNSGNRTGEDTGADPSLNLRYGTYRTLCVRKTDGYYFPISFSTVPDRFDFDEELCQNMCPSSDVALYVHRMPNEDSEDMIAYRSEIPYAKEPFAFAYRKSHNPQNTCRYSTAGITQSVDADATGEVTVAKKEIRIGVPVFRKDPTIAPDVYDNSVTEFSSEKALAYVEAIRNSDKDGKEELFAGDRNVRIVGPAFFPVQ